MFVCSVQTYIHTHLNAHDYAVYVQFIESIRQAHTHTPLNRLHDDDDAARAMRNRLVRSSYLLPAGGRDCCCGEVIK